MSGDLDETARERPRHIGRKSHKEHYVNSMARARETDHERRPVQAQSQRLALLPERGRSPRAELGPGPRCFLENEAVVVAEHAQVEAVELLAFALDLGLEARLDVVQQRRQLVRGSVLPQIGRERLRRMMPR